MNRRVLFIAIAVCVVLATIVVLGTASQTTASSLAALLARAKSLELETPYVPPPGNPLDHHASGFAKVMCSAVFITGLDPDFAAENVGYFTAPYAIRSQLGKPVVDRAQRAVHVAVPNGVTRTARHFGSQGCITLPVGRDAPAFTPVTVHSRLPDPTTQPWPMGDVLPKDPLPREIDALKVKQAMDGRASAISTCRTASGTVNGSCRRDS